MSERQLRDATALDEVAAHFTVDGAGTPLPLRRYPDPTLRAVAKVADVGEQFCLDLAATCVKHQGVGLAASQVGDEREAIVVNVFKGAEPMVLTHPRILRTEGEEIDVEACLSIPGVSGHVKRPQSIEVVAFNVAGQVVEILAEGFLARVICHEVDHLNGVLFTDHLRGLERERAQRRMKKMARMAKKRRRAA